MYIVFVADFNLCKKNYSTFTSVLYRRDILTEYDPHVILSHASAVLSLCRILKV